MKRILILALVAITVVACEQKNEEISRHDKNALKLVTVDAVQLLGKNSAAVEKSLLKAGFVLVADTTKTQMPALRANMPEMINMPQKITPNRVSTYKYGDQDGLRTKGDTYIIAYAAYYEDVFVVMQCYFFKKIDDKINLLYKEISDLQISKIPENVYYWSWRGTNNFYEQDKTLSYTDHERYVTDIGASTPIDTEEQGVAQTSVFGTEGYVYHNKWQYPSAAIQDTMLLKGFSEPYVIGTFTTQSVSTLL